MKIIVFSFLVCFATFSFSEDLSKLTEAQVKTLLCQKWKLSFLEYKGKKKSIPAKLPESLLIFLQDGKLQEYSGAQKYDGTWSYLHTTKTITTIDKDGTEKHQLISLNANELIMNGTYQGFKFNMGFKKAD